LSKDWSGAIGLLQIDGKAPGEVSTFLHNTYKIHSVSIEWENIKGVRLTPNVYTTTRDLDVLVKAIREFAKT
jgi:selenocysteine lyase/cysteine desulfurase